MSRDMDRYRIALSGDFRKPDGSFTFPSFDLSPLAQDPRIEIVWVDAVDGVMPAEPLAGCHGLILLVPRFTAASIPPDNSLAFVARFGVGYDSVDVDACTDNAISLVITPDGVRRPVAVSVITFVLALSQKLLIKDRLCREGPSGWARRGEFMGTGLVGKTLGQLGMGNIGAEVFRLAAPFGMHLLAHDPFADEALARELGVELVSAEELFRRSDFLSVSIPLSDDTRHYVNAERLTLMKPTAFVINTARGPVVDQRALHDAIVAGRIAGAGLGHRLISSHPDSYGCEFNESKVVGVMFFIAGCDGSEVFDLVEKAFDQVAQAIEQRAEGGDVDASGHRLDVGPGAALGQRLAQSIAVIGPVRQEDLARSDGGQHVAGTSAVMGLTRRQLEHQRQAIGIDQGMDLGCQPAPRAPHASGVTRVPSGGIGLFETPFLTLAAC